MALDRENQLLDVSGSFIHQQFNDQKWYKANSNFVTTIGGFLATLVAWASTQAFADDPRVQVGILIAGFLLTAFGVKITPNGFSNSQLAKINTNRAEVIGNTRLAVPAEVVTSETAGVQEELFDLDTLVEDYNAKRE